MNVVIYTRDLEPITIIDLPQWAIEVGERRYLVSVGVMSDVDFFPPVGPGDPVNAPIIRTVTLEFVPIRLGSDLRRSCLIMTDDEVLAMRLRPSWLPGQRSKINDYECRNKELACLLIETLARGIGGH